MKVYVCPKYGTPDVIRLSERPMPEPKADEVLIEIRATSVTSGDVRLRRADFPLGLRLLGRLALGLSGPRQPVLGTELSGVVVATGSAVKKFKVGDAVIAFPGGAMGCHAAYRCMPEGGAVALKPEALSFEEAATLCFGGCTALHFIERLGVKSGDSILLIGASGGVGTAFLQIATALGANVTAVSSGGNRQLVTSLGAVDFVDYTTTEVPPSDKIFDIIVDTTGSTGYGKCRHALRAGGQYLALTGDLADMLAMLWTPLIHNTKVIAGPAAERPAYVTEIARLAATGTLRSVVDRSYPFDQLIDAHAYVDTGRKRGSVAITLDR